jgi:HEAT repeat protein
MIGQNYPLINALKDTDSYVRGQAARSLGEIKDTHAVQPLINVGN